MSSDSFQSVFQIKKRLIVVFILGFSSGLPLSLLTSTLQAWFSSAKVPLMTTGLLSLIGLPYLFRFVWSHWLDRYTLWFIGKRRSWILLSQGVLIVGFNGLAWLQPEQSPQWVAAIACILAFASATQDAAIDAHRIEYLPTAVHGLGASLAVFGYRLSFLLAGGLSFILAQILEFPVIYRLAGCMMLIGVCAILFSREPDMTGSSAGSVKPGIMSAIVDLYNRSGFAVFVCFIIFYKMGEAFTATSSGIVVPFLIQGLGFELDVIGYVNKFLGIGAILLGGFFAGLVLLRWSLYNALMLFGILQAISNVLFVALAWTGKNLLLFTIAATCDNFSAGLTSTALVALFMRTVNKNCTATQFSILVAISAIPRVLSGPLAVLLQKYLGWVGLYESAVFIALMFIPFLMMNRRNMLDEIVFSPQLPDKSANASVLISK